MNLVLFVYIWSYQIIVFLFVLFVSKVVESFKNCSNVETIFTWMLIKLLNLLILRSIMNKNLKMLLVSLSSVCGTSERSTSWCNHLPTWLSIMMSSCQFYHTKYKMWWIHNILTLNLNTIIRGFCLFSFGQSDKVKLLLINLFELN